MASGDTLCVFDALDGVPGDADYATLDTILSASADEPDNVVPVLKFDPGATEEYIYFRGYMPAHYDGGGVTATVVWSTRSTTASETCTWELAFKSFTDGVDDIDSKAFAAPKVVNADIPSTTAGTLGYDNIAFTDGADMDSVAAGEMFWLELSRDGSAGGNDDMNSNDAEFHQLILKET